MATSDDSRGHEATASAAQMHDLSRQVQVMQTQVTALWRRMPNERRRAIDPYLVAIMLLGVACIALFCFPPRERTVVRYVPQVKVVHDVRILIATPVPVVTPADGVSVCTSSGFDLAAAHCVRSAAQLRLTDLEGARVSYTGKDGGAFTATQATIVLSERNSAGSLSLIGRLPVEVLLASSNQASRLQGVFDALNTTPRQGSSYTIEVDQGNSALGAASFAILSDYAQP